MKVNPLALIPIPQRGEMPKRDGSARAVGRHRLPAKKPAQPTLGRAASRCFHRVIVFASMRSEVDTVNMATAELLFLSSLTYNT